MSLCRMRDESKAAVLLEESSPGFSQQQHAHTGERLLSINGLFKHLQIDQQSHVFQSRALALFI